MATDYTNSPSVGDTVNDNGNIKRWNGTYWESVAPVGPGVVVTEITDGSTFTPPTGARWHQVHLWGPGDDEPEIASYTVTEMGANASVNIGTEADGTDSTFNPAGTGATLTASASDPVAWHLLESGSKSGATSYDIDISAFDTAGYTQLNVIVTNISWANVSSGYEDLYLRMSDDGGSTFTDTLLEENIVSHGDARANDTIYARSRDGLSELFVADCSTGQDVDTGNSYSIWFRNPFETGRWKSGNLVASYEYYSSGQQQDHFWSGWHRLADDAIDAIQLVNRYGAPVNIAFDYRILGLK